MIPNQTKVVAMTQITTTTAKDASRTRMGAKIGSGVLSFQRHRQPLPFLRIAQELGYAKEKTARDRLSRPYLQVAKTNLCLRASGHTDKLAELMAVVDASLTDTLPISLYDALHDAEMADCQEQIADESFRDKLRKGAATVDDAREYLKRSAIQRAKAEVAERETLLWIAEQEDSK